MAFASFELGMRSVVLVGRPHPWGPPEGRTSHCTDTLTASSQLRVGHASRHGKAAKPNPR